MVLKQYSQITHDDSKHKTSAKRDTASGVCGLDASKEVINDVPVSKLVDMGEQSFENLIDNGDFKLWPAGVSAAPAGWLDGDSPTILQETTIIKVGLNSLKLTASAIGSRVYQSIGDVSRYKGRAVTLGCWVYSSTAGNTKIGIVDTSGSDYVFGTGGDVWEWVNVTRLISPTATAIYWRIYPDNIGGVDSVYISGAMLVEGPVCPAFSPKPVTDPHTYGEMYIYNNSTATVIETADTPIALRQISSGLQNGFIFNAGSTGVISAYGNYGGTVAGTVYAIDGTHGLSTGDIITIRGTTNYNGIHEITDIDGDSFYFTDTWVANDGASDWDKGASLTAQSGADGIYNATWQMTAAPAGACRAIFFININATPQIKSGAPRELAINDEDNNSSTCLLEISEGDILWLSVQSDSTTDITHTYGNINIGRAPA